MTEYEANAINVQESVLQRWRWMMKIEGGEGRATPQNRRAKR